MSTPASLQRCVLKNFPANRGLVLACDRCSMRLPKELFKKKYRTFSTVNSNNFQRIFQRCVSCITQRYLNFKIPTMVHIVHRSPSVVVPFKSSTLVPGACRCTLSCTVSKVGQLFTLMRTRTRVLHLAAYQLLMRVSMNRNIAQYAFCSRTIAQRGSVSCKKGGSVSQTELQCSDDLMMNVVFFFMFFLNLLK